MTPEQFNAIKTFRDEYKAKCVEWNATCKNLNALQKAAAEKDTPPYPIETPVVYNRALDEITADDQINIIVIGDNPGKDEQLEKNNRYLVGQSGKIAEGFFRKYPSLKTDFRKNAIILNKTAVHTAKTQHLKYLSKNSPEAAALILQSQIWLAKKTAELHQALVAGASSSNGGAMPCELWLVGYAELKENGIFTPYRDALMQAYNAASTSSGKECPQSTRNGGKMPNGMSNSWQRVYVYQHFSMNRFLIDLKEFSNAESCAAIDEATLKDNLEALGAKHRKEIFGK